MWFLMAADRVQGSITSTGLAKCLITQSCTHLTFIILYVISIAMQKVYLATEGD